MGNERKADILFLASACIFAAVFWWRMEEDTVLSETVYFLAQSALIGCAADWFAVTALFRKPLGFPYHTALIPRYRMRIIASVRRLVEEKLLRPESWEETLAAFSLSAWIQRRLGEGSARERMEASLCDKGASFLLQLAGEKKEALTESIIAAWPVLSSRLEETLREEALREGRVETILAKCLAWGRKEASAAETADKLEAFLRKTADEKKKNFLVAMAISMAESMGVINYRDMALSIQQALTERLAEWEDPAHPVHLRLKKDLEEALKSFLSSEAVKEAIEKERLAAGCHPFFQHLLEGGLEDMERFWREDGRLSALLAPGVHEGLGRILTDEAVKQYIDKAARDFLHDFLRAMHGYIGETVETVLESYDAGRLNTFVHSKVKEELGWIRINGALVAAFAGTVLYLFITWCWIPLMREWGIGI